MQQRPRQFANVLLRCTTAFPCYLRSMKRWNQIGVVGAGTMGSGIAQIAAQAGCSVVLVDAAQEALTHSEINFQGVSKVGGERTPDRVGSSRNRSTDHPDHRLAGLGPMRCRCGSHCGRLDRKNIFVSNASETIVSETAVLATNTSSLSVTALASGCSHPERVIGLHFFNPAPLMALVESWSLPCNPVPS